MLTGWRLLLAERFDRAFGGNDAVKCALATGGNALWCRIA
jgi:hypothetical protein